MLWFLAMGTVAMCNFKLLTWACLVSTQFSSIPSLRDLILTGSPSRLQACLLFLSAATASVKYGLEDMFPVIMWLIIIMTLPETRLFMQATYRLTLGEIVKNRTSSHRDDSPIQCCFLQGLQTYPPQHDMAGARRDLVTFKRSSRLQTTFWPIKCLHDCRPLTFVLRHCKQCKVESELALS